MGLPQGSPNLQTTFDELARGLRLRAVVTAPKPKPGTAIPFVVLNAGSGKHELRVQFPTGASILVATEP